MHMDLFYLGGYPSPIWAHDHREADTEMEAGTHADLLPIVDDPSPGQAHKRRESEVNSYDEDPLAP